MLAVVARADITHLVLARVWEIQVVVMVQILML
jgi:hypothetical protein